MRRQIKHLDSEVLLQNLKYVVGNSKNNLKIRLAILREQKGFCAYTEEYISVTDAVDVEHFNPRLKNTDDDGYDNWFVVKHRLNQTKGTKWEKLQPIMLPTDEHFENRIGYYEGDYFANSADDQEASNLIKFLRLDDPELASNRKRYIARKRNEISEMEQTPLDFFKLLIHEYPAGINYVRAINEEFGIDILKYL